MEQDDFGELTGRSPHRRRLRDGRNRQARGFYIGLALAVIGVPLLIGGIALQAWLFGLPGGVLAAVGAVLMLFNGEWSYRQVGTFQGRPVVRREFGAPNDPAEAEINAHVQRRERDGVEAWLGQTAESTAKVRCRSCDALNDEQARFCDQCGGLLRSE